VLAGVSVWDLTANDGHRVLYVVVPGNVGGPETLVSILDAVGYPAADASSQRSSGRQTTT
jgi:hypothetical protein